MNMGIWENIGKTIEREEKVFNDKELDIESLKELVAANPIKEATVIDQKDIEELDNEIDLLGL